ncbi:hypothetical protein B1H18_11750 [Streptomyces tsukubensis]|uniref:ScoMcrA-like N-terminal head domain-containing protein n=1 Tax=Streptomyces tsukubensis TaxID=83656 RepID=A0A1V4ABA8_9ACTN|nr:hypothetical protein B1H18_11750 [Streptomyces tsukubensis]
MADISRTEIDRALAEFDCVGRRTFLELNGFREAQTYFIESGGQLYDSTAIVGTAHGYLPDQQALSAADFSGGALHAVQLLRRLGHTVTERERPGQTRVPAPGETSIPSHDDSEPAHPAEAVAAARADRRTAAKRAGRTAEQHQPRAWSFLVMDDDERDFQGSDSYADVVAGVEAPAAPLTPPSKDHAP